MQSSKWSILLLMYAAGAVHFTGCAAADTIITSDGKEIKGIVVEDYKDRIIFSTVDGEVTFMKSDVRELSFDSEEDNLIKLAGQAVERRDYPRAVGYYNLALKVNPDSAEARQGISFISGSLFKKEEAMKAADIKKRQDIELYGGASPVTVESDDIGAMDGKLDKSTGMKIAIVDNMPKIDALNSGSRAYEAGIRKGDILVSVWGRLTGYLSLKEILDLLVNRSAIEISCEIERGFDVKINPNKTIISRPEDLIGASFGMGMDGLSLTSIKESKSAMDAGLQKGDLVMEIDGKRTRYMPLKKAVELIRNSKEGVVRLTVRRKAIIWRSREI